MYVATQRRKRGIRGLGQDYGYVGADPSIPGSSAQIAFDATQPPPDATDCSYWDFFFNPASWKACAAAAEVGQIQRVVTNAQTYYGANSPAAIAAIASAADQEAQAPADVANVANFYGAGQIAPPAGVPWWAWVALGVGTLVVVKSL